MPRLAFAAPIALALTAAASSAHAQPAAFAPPGQCDCAAPAAAVVAAPLPELPRWSIGLALTSTSLADKNTPDQQSDWGGGEWRLGFRVFPHWELGLELGAAAEKLADGNTGRTLGMGLFTVKWHPAPYARWDFYALAGAGTASISPPGVTEADPKSDRGAGMLGVGIERRFGHIGVSAELRGLGLSPIDASTNDAPSSAMPLVGSTTTTPSPASADGGFGGGSFSLAASYEF